MGSSRWRPPLAKRRVARVIAVGAAGPGVGKSVVASNLAVALAGLGPHVVLVDLDLGAARQQSLFGIKRALPGVQAWLDRKIETLEASLTSTGIRNLHLVTGASPAPGRALPAQQKRELMEQLAHLDGDVVVVDVGMDNRDDLLDYFAAGALRVLVSGPEQGAIETSFAFLKGASLRAQSLYGPGAREALARFRGRLVGNNTKTPEEAESFHAFSRLVRDHLGIPLPVLGCLRGSDRIAQSVVAQRPLLARRGLDENVRAFHSMAEALMMEGVVSDDACELSTDAPVDVAQERLPVELRSYLRQYSRYPVDWAARLELDGRQTDVRVLDVSFTGAAIEVFTDLRAGDRGWLRFEQLQGQPTLEVIVKNVVPTVRRIGVSFEEPGEVSSRLVAAASALATATARRRDDPPRRPEPTPTS
ncbi:MAG TPA: PilZ domain-containing protein [Polyangia bacterium]|jgi:flagellar biosynthesis protein FlhG|nr:PilZ domain-containing protein [Polyangia bacterium]